MSMRYTHRKYIYISIYIQRKFLWGGGTLEKSLGESVECLYAKKNKKDIGNS